MGIFFSIYSHQNLKLFKQLANISNSCIHRQIAKKHKLFGNRSKSRNEVMNSPTYEK